MKVTKDILVITHNIMPFHGIQKRLDSDNVTLCHVSSIEEAIWKMQMHSFCLIILDVSISDETGIENITAIRKVNPMPILVFTEKNDVEERINLLKSGADDIVQKPYDLDECIAKIEVHLRRYTELNYVKENRYAIVSHDGLLLDIGRRVLSVNGKEIGLTPKEYGILELLMKNRRQIMTSEQIYESVWKEVYLGEADKEAVFYHIGQLRRKIGRERIESVYGTGYRLKEEPVE